MKKTVKSALTRHLCHCRGTTATLHLLLLTILTLVTHAADDQCNGQRSTLGQEEVAVVCPVREDIHNTKHSVVFRHFNGTDSHPVDVFACDWISKQNNFDCITKFGFELVAIYKDHVVVKVARDKLLTTGSYRCQLAPAHIDEVHTNCSICFPDEPKASAVLESTSPEVEEKLHGCPACQAEKDCQGISIAVLVLCILITVLLALNTFLLAAILFKRKHRALESNQGRPFIPPTTT